MKIKVVGYISVSVWLAVVSLLAVAGPLPKDGESYDATILQTSKCSHSIADKPCWRLAIELSNGTKLNDVELFGFAKFIDHTGATTYKYPYLLPDGTITKDVPDNSKEAKQISDSFYAAAAKFKKGARVHLEALTCEIPDAPPNSKQCESMGVTEF